MKKWGAFLVDMLKLNQPGKGNARLIGELISLSAGKRTAVRNFYIHKMVVLTAVLLAGLLLSLLSFFFYEDGSGKEIQILDRPGYGEGDRKEELTVQIEGQTEEQMLEVTVREQTYTDQEKKQLLEQAIAQLEELLPGENDSLDQVRMRIPDHAIKGRKARLLRTDHAQLLALPDGQTARLAAQHAICVVVQSHYSNTRSMPP